ncbi:MAG: sigma-54-dependent Fis family transcriptional regulator [Gemmatimonadetes bacterium]|jgi:DNA-binding NtrC family response regulator|nr:sigma-54-dependent Fis family transcriptional regulator [Gemmatimonadota bacterium]
MENDRVDGRVAQILLVDDRPENLKILRDVLRPEGYRILIANSGAAALWIAAGRGPDLILLDVVMPEMNGYEACRRLKEDGQTGDIPVIFITARGDKESLLQGFAAGGVDYIAKPFAAEEVLARVRTHLENSRLTRTMLQKNAELQATNERLREEIGLREQAEEARERADERLQLISQQEADRWGIKGFVGKSATIRKILEETRQLQRTDISSVLILGESGTGKELIARAIHFGGEQAQGPFIPVNCSAIPGELAESSFFGHRQGAFTGAVADRKGYFEMADGGTLFLDEVGEMPPELQAKLLRVLENGRIMPVGSQEEREVNVHVLAATNADLSVRMGKGMFRRDLYFRLARCTVTIPPLRERQEDIPLLVEHFIRLFAEEMGYPPPAVDQAALKRLDQYSFPGNVRELKNLIESALIKSSGKSILPEHLQFLSGVDEGNGGNGTPETMRTEIPSQSSGQAEAVRAYVEKNGSITNAECRQFLSISRYQATYLLDKLTAIGMLMRSGSHRGAHYHLVGDE